MFTIQSRPLQGYVIELFFEGALDLSTNQTVSDRIGKLLLKGRRSLVINLEKLTFIDMAGLNSLIDAYKEVKRQEGTLSFVSPCEILMKVFHLTGLDKSKLFKLCDDEKKAVEGLSVLSADCRKCAVFGMPFCALLKSLAYPSKPCEDPSVRLPWLSPLSPVHERVEA